MISDNDITQVELDDDTALPFEDEGQAAMGPMEAVQAVKAEFAACTEGWSLRLWASGWPR